MGNKRAALSVLLFCLCAFVSTSGIALASSGNWVEVTRFTGIETGEITTEPFTCDYVEWRIRWNSSPAYARRSGARVGLFMIQVYNHSTGKYVSSVGNGPSNKSEIGTLSLNENGTFHLNIGGLFRGEYLVIVEQNIESIPEFPSWTPLLIMLLSVSILVFIYKRRIQNQGRQKQ